MFNPKISGIAAGIGFILSFLLGIITGARVPLVLFRAFVFAAVFFALASAGYWAIKKYLPELADTVLGGVEETPAPGGQVDISIGAGDDDAMDAGAFGDGLNEFFENPGETGGDTLDQNDEDDYTKEGNLEETPAEQPAATVDILPDLDRMAGAFGSGFAQSGGESAAARSPAAGGLASTGSLFDIEDKGGAKKGLTGDFNAQEMASAIQTILKREDKG
jgi:hypothetical protein